MLVNCDVIVIFQFMANLEQSRSRISYAQSVKLTFLLIAIFHLTKIENKTKKFHTIALNKGTIFAKKC